MPTNAQLNAQVLQLQAQLQQVIQQQQQQPQPQPPQPNPQARVPKTTTFSGCPARSIKDLLDNKDGTQHPKRWLVGFENTLAAHQFVIQPHSVEIATIAGSKCIQRAQTWYTSWKEANPQGPWHQWKTDFLAHFGPKYDQQTRNLFDKLQLRGDPAKFVEAVRKLTTDRTTEIQTEEVRRKLGEALQTNRATFMTATNDQMGLDDLENKFLDTCHWTQSIQPNGPIRNSRHRHGQRPNRFNFNRRRTDRNHNNNSEGQRRKTCFKCNKPGHFARECKSNNPKPYIVSVLTQGQFLHASVQIAGRRYTCIFDTGATSNFLREGILEPTTAGPTTTITLANNTNISGTIQHAMRLQIRERTHSIDVIEIPNMPSGIDLILGLPYMTEYRPKFDYERRILIGFEDDNDGEDGREYRRDVRTAGDDQKQDTQQDLPGDSRQTDTTSTPSDNAATTRPASLNKGLLLRKKVKAAGRSSKKKAKEKRRRMRQNPHSSIDLKELNKLERKGKHTLLVIPNDTLLALTTDDDKRDQYRDNMEEIHQGPLGQLIKEYEDIFRDELPDELPPERPSVDLHLATDTNSPLYRPQFPLSPKQKKAIDGWLSKMLAAKLIQPSRSPHAAPTFAVAKAGTDEYRIVHDYRLLNQHLLPMQTQMTTKDDIIRNCAEDRIFSTMDITMAFHQIRLTKHSRPYTAFHTHHGRYEYLVAPMGTSTSPGALQRLTQDIFRDLAATDAYYDDILVHTKTEEDHLEALRATFCKLREQKIYIKLRKCRFAKHEVPFLGDFLGADGIRPDPSKIKTIRDWPEPTTSKELHSFMGLCGYLQRFVHQYAAMVTPLFAMLQKKTHKAKPLQWSETTRAAFANVKHALANTPVLAIPDFSKQFLIKADTSLLATGAVLYQIDEQGNERPIAFMSKKLDKHQRNYSSQHRELLGVVTALRHFAVYCRDQPPIVYTDHKSLTVILKQKGYNQRLYRWYLTLAEFRPIIRYIPGPANDVADALSRVDIPFGELCLDADDDDDGPKRMNVCLMAMESTFLDQVKTTQLRSPQLTQIRRRLVEFPDARTNYFCRDETLWYQSAIDTAPRLVIPRQFVAQCIREAHSTTFSGHPGIEQTYGKLRRLFYWRRMHSSVRRFVQQCLPCQRSKHRTRTQGLLQPITIPTGRWTHIGTDFITSLPPCTRDGYEYTQIWTIVCYLTKRCHFIPLPTNADAKDIAEAFYKLYVPLHGLPNRITSDRDPKFISLFWREVMRISGTSLNHTVANRPQADGLAERNNQRIELYLRHYVNGFQNDWVDHLPHAEIALNGHHLASIEMSPFEADLGYLPNNPLSLALPTISTTHRSAQAHDFIRRQRQIYERCHESIQAAQDSMIYYADRSHSHTTFAVNDRVMLDTTGLPIHHLAALKRKLGPRFIGPFTIVQRVHANAYRLKFPPGCKLHSVFNVASLKPYHAPDPEFVDPQAPGIPVALDSATIGYVVERILRRRRHRGHVQYLIKWANSSDTTWEPLDHLSNILSAVHAFDAQNPRSRSGRWTPYIL